MGTLNLPTWRGLRVLNTRPAGQAAPLSNALRQAGAIPIEQPLLAIEPSSTDWCHTLPNLTHLQTAIFVSPNAVQYFFQVIDPSDWPDSIQTLCIGLGTADAFHQFVQTVVIMPRTANSEQLLALSCLQTVRDQSILLIKGERGRTMIEETLQQRAANLSIVCVYRRITPAATKKNLESLFGCNGIDMIVITSQRSLDHLFHCASPAARAWLCGKQFLVLSPRLAAAATQWGVQHLIHCTYHELMLALQQSILKD